MCIINLKIDYPDSVSYLDTYSDTRGQRGLDNRGSTVHIFSNNT